MSDRVGELSFERELRQAFVQLSAGERATLLRFWSLSTEERAARIGELFSRGHTSAADFLIDAEADPIVRLTLKEQLLVLDREQHQGGGL